MYVHPFWFGVLCTLVAEIIFACIAAYINVVRNDREERRRANGEKRNNG